MSQAVTELALFRIKPPTQAQGIEQLVSQSPPTPTPQSHTSNTSSTGMSSTTAIPNPLLADLEAAAHAQASFSGFPVFILQCIEDPSLIYLVGGWSSIAQHIDEWIPSRQNRDFMATLTQRLDFLWMFHLDLHPDLTMKILRMGSSSGEYGIDTDADATLPPTRSDAEIGIVAIGRHFVRHDVRDAFEKMWFDNIGTLQAFVGESDRGAGNSRMQRGWAIDYGAFVMHDPRRKEMCASEGVRDGNGEGGVQVEEMVMFTAWSSVDRHLQFAKTGQFERFSQIRQFMVGSEMKQAKVVSEKRNGID